MICPHCNKESSDDMSFCTNCGYQLPETDSRAESLQDPAKNQSYGARSLDAPDNDQANLAGENFGRNNYPNPAYDNESHNVQQHQFNASTPTYKKKKSKKPLIVVLVSLILVVAAIATYVVISLNGPLTKIAKALENTYEAGNLSADFEIKIDGEKFEGSIQAKWDLDNREITLYFEAGESDDDESVIIAIYEENFIYGETDSRGECDEYFAEDISEYIDYYFDIYEEAKENTKDVEFLSEEFFENLLEDIDDDLYEELEEYIYFAEIRPCFESCVKLLNNKSWLEENAGLETYKEDGIQYFKFNPNIETFAKAIMPETEPIFRDKDDFEDFCDAIYDEAEEADDEFDKLYGYIGIKDGKLSKIGYEIKVDGEKFSGKISFYDVGKTNIDTDKLEKLLGNADEYGRWGDEESGFYSDYSMDYYDDYYYDYSDDYYDYSDDYDSSLAAAE